MLKFQIDRRISKGIFSTKFHFHFILLRMLVENKCDVHDWSGRWSHVQKLLLRSGPLAHQDFEPGPQV